MKITKDRLDEAIHMGRHHGPSKLTEEMLSILSIVLYRLLVHGDNDFGLDLPPDPRDAEIFKSSEYVKFVISRLGMSDSTKHRARQHLDKLVRMAKDNAQV